MATATNDKPVRIGDLPIIKKDILENARQYDKGVVGGYNGTFPLTAASQGGIYLVPATNKFYVCTDNYNGTQISAPNDKFVELSVWKNHDRLNNLFSFTSGPNGTAIIFSNRLAIQYNFGKIKNNIIEAALPIPYADRNYSVVFSFDTDSLDDPDKYTSTNVLTKNTSSFKFGTYKDNTTGFSWITVGYVK